MVVARVNKDRRRDGDNESTRLKRIKKQAVRKRSKPHLSKPNCCAIMYNMKINFTWNIEFLLTCNASKRI